MTYDINWIIPKLRKPGAFWNCASSLTIAFVGIVTKVITGWLNQTTIHNVEIMEKMFKRPVSTPLITISNHHSCFDDPGLWGPLNVRYLCSRKNLRWALTAHDICFTNLIHSVFFSLGKCIPVVRGTGVNQPAIDFAIEQMGLGSWLHVFPEGRVNMSKEEMRLKWGVGRIIYESPRAPLVVPIWHEGMDQVLPNTEPYMFRFRKKITLHYGQPIDVEDIIQTLRKKEATPEEARKVITDYLQEKLYSLRDETLKMLSNNNQEQLSNNCSDSQKDL